ncbi:MAG TPA: hypothetical protein VK966_10040 [Longimicrobiales bacterium]|nr:hypothetical protein [Longimicrobiales bacterium]
MMYRRYVYTDDASAGVDWTTSLPCPPWVPGSHGIGGREMSASRVVSSYELRRDQTIRDTIRFTESEWATVRKMLEHGQRGTEIAVYLDSDSATHRDCLLVAPVYGEAIRPRRSDFPGHYEIDVEWLDTDDTGWDTVEFYGG